MSASVDPVESKSPDDVATTGTTTATAAATTLTSTTEASSITGGDATASETAPTADAPSEEKEKEETAAPSTSAATATASESTGTSEEKVTESDELKTAATGSEGKNLTPEEETTAQRDVIAACEDEIGQIKARLKALTTAQQQQQQQASTTSAADATSTTTTNRLTITWIKTEGVRHAVKPKLTIQLSSPVEEAVLTEVKSQQQDANQDTPATTAENNKDSTSSAPESEEGGGEAKSEVTFRGVETGQATLTITAMHVNIPIGVSETYDVSKYTVQQLDKNNNATDDAATTAMTTTTTRTLLTVPMYPAESSGAPKPDSNPVCTVTLELSFSPSATDLRNQLYDQLNAVSQRKATALEKYRQAATSLALAQQRKTTTGGRTASAAAVQPGFLNKKKKTATKTPATIANMQQQWKEWFQKNLGEQSLAQQIFWMAKNYIVFAGFVVWAHFRGHYFALPPP